MNPKVHGNAMPFEWQGQTYYGIRAVCEACGRTRQTVAYHLRTYGNLDRLGVGQGNHDNHRPPPRSRPIGRWPSAAALARAVGLDPKLVQKWRRQGKDEKLMMLMLEVDRHPPAEVHEYRVRQGGMVVAATRAKDRGAAEREAMHYAMMYVADGAVEVQYRGGPKQRWRHFARIGRGHLHADV